MGRGRAGTIFEVCRGRRKPSMPRSSPRVRAALGSEWTPGVDNDPHIVILHAMGLGEGVAGYTTGIDELPRSRSHTRTKSELIVVSDALDVGSADYYGLLARQYAHIIQWPHDRNESRWLKQGLADLAAQLSGDRFRRVAGLPVGHGRLLAAEGPGVLDPAQRGAAYLLVQYFHERFEDEGRKRSSRSP